MQTVDEGKLFQSDAQLKIAQARRQKSLADCKPNAENGYPVILPSKPLQIIIDGSDAYIAQNGFVAQRVDIKSGKIKATFRGHTGPVTSLSVSSFTLSSQKKRKILFTGSWDKTIKMWDVETQILLSTSMAHVDFVKSIHLIPSLWLLVSGSTDRDIRLWSFDELFQSFNWNDIDTEFQERRKARLQANHTGSVAEIARDEAIIDAPAVMPNFQVTSLNVRTKWPPAMYDSMICIGDLKSHTRPIDSLSSHASVAMTAEETYIKTKDGTLPHLLVSADSMGALKVWLLQPSQGLPKRIEGSIDSTAWPHKTAINDIQIGCEICHEIDHQTKAQIWTASADNSLLCSTLDLLPTSTQRLIKILRIEQPYFIRCVLNIPLFFAQNDPESSYPNWLITGSTDENIRIYDLDDIEEKSKSKITSTQQPWHKECRASTANPCVISNGWFGCLKAHWHEVNCLRMWLDPDTREQWLVSSSLDGTFRRWKLKELQQRFVTQGQVDDPLACHQKQRSVEKSLQFELTAEEEAELAEMMDKME